MLSRTRSSSSGVVASVPIAGFGFAEAQDRSIIATLAAAAPSIVSGVSSVIVIVRCSLP